MFMFFQKIMQIVYLDSLEHDEPIQSASDCRIRAAAWSNQLIQAVMLKDRKPNGEFGKMRVRYVFSFFFLLRLKMNICVFASATSFVLTDILYAAQRKCGCHYNGRFVCWYDAD